MGFAIQTGLSHVSSPNCRLVGQGKRGQDRLSSSGGGQIKKQGTSWEGQLQKGVAICTSTCACERLCVRACACCLMAAVRTRRIPVTWERGPQSFPKARGVPQGLPVASSTHQPTGISTHCLTSLSLGLP